MPFADRAQAENESPAARRHSRLIWIGNDTRVEQRRRLERILMQEIGADQPALVKRERGMCGQGLFHLICARLEGLEQTAVASEEILENVGQLTGDGLRIQREHTI